MYICVPMGLCSTLGCKKEGPSITVLRRGGIVAFLRHIVETPESSLCILAERKPGARKPGCLAMAV